MLSAFLIAVVLQLAVFSVRLIFGLLRAGLWLVTVPVWDGIVLLIAGAMWLAGGLVGAELPRLQLERFGFLTFQWERPGMCGYALR